MAYQPDITAVAPALELTLQYIPASLRCTGTLDTRTRCHFVEAVEELLASAPSSVTIHIGELHVGDVDGANTLAHAQRLAREAGIRLRWRGLDSGHLRGILALQHRARRPLEQSRAKPS